MRQDKLFIRESFIWVCRYLTELKNLQSWNSDLLAGQHTKETRIMRSHQKQTLPAKCVHRLCHRRFKAKPNFLGLQGLWVKSALSRGVMLSAHQAGYASHFHQVWKSAARQESSLKSAVRLHLARRSTLPSRRAWLFSMDVLSPASLFLLMRTYTHAETTSNTRTHTHAHT